VNRGPGIWRIRVLLANWLFEIQIWGRLAPKGKRHMKHLRTTIGLAAAVTALMHSPSMGLARDSLRGTRLHSAGLECSQNGRSYPEGTSSEGMPPHLCLPSGICTIASVVLPVYQCVGGQWRCVRYCVPVPPADGRRRQ
jgi:hypothetical protein